MCNTFSVSTFIGVSFFYVTHILLKIITIKIKYTSSKIDRKTTFNKIILDLTV